MSITDKFCSSCSTHKPILDGFYKHKKNPDGLAYVCKECAKKQRANYYKVNANRIKKRTVAYRRRIRIETLNAYGGAICLHCGETKFNCLTLDHIGQDGAKQRRDGQARGGGKLCANLRRNNYPQGFRVLCFNCNWKAWLKYKQKNQSNTKKAKWARGWSMRRKQLALKAYGGTVCVACGERDIDVLSLDHIDGGGREHVAVLQQEPSIRGGRALYHWVRKNNYPPGFRVLCLNCNCSIDRT
jgi:hypothetical protein